MALNFSFVASSLNSVYDDIKTRANPELGVNQSFYPPDPSLTEFRDAFATIYDQDANACTFSMQSIVMQSLPDLLKYTPTGTCSGADMIGAKIAQYWSSQVTPGTPQFCTNIDSVTNDAAKIQAPIDAYICGLMSSEQSPHYEHLFQFIETQVKTIIWTVSESGASCSNVYTVNIS